MKCPRCVQVLQSGIQQCPHCSFSLAYLDAQFGEDSVVLERLTDAAGCLFPGDRTAIEGILDAFEQQFPQLFLAVYVGFLPEITDNRQFAFWLLNRATVPSLDYRRPNENGALLVLDLSSRSISFTLGYFIEPYFSDHELATLLKKGHPHLVDDEFGPAFLKIIPAFTKLLGRKSRESGAYQREHVQSPTVASGLLDRVRGDERGFQNPVGEPQGML